jgi:hypothetical protein
MASLPPIRIGHLTKVNQVQSPIQHTLKYSPYASQEGCYYFLVNYASILGGVATSLRDWS